MLAVELAVIGGRWSVHGKKAGVEHIVDSKASGRCEFTSNKYRDIVSGMALATGDCGLRFPNQNRRLAPSRSGKFSSAARLIMVSLGVDQKTDHPDRGLEKRTRKQRLLNVNSDWRF